LAGRFAAGFGGVGLDAQHLGAAADAKAAIIEASSGGLDGRNDAVCRDRVYLDSVDCHDGLRRADYRRALRMALFYLSGLAPSRPTFPFIRGTPKCMAHAASRLFRTRLGSARR
jgi:hypothetical protein